ncbi:MAG: hypothetical protein IPM24_10930 [Bryobacterales bacterium]|nr:hypothetical protein [Bryobacterales bacterium]
MRRLFVSVAICTLCACGRPAPEQTASWQGIEFSRMLVHWQRYTEPGYLDFVSEAQPEVVQVGFYGADFWALAHVPQAIKKRTAARQPVDGDLKASGAYFENLNRELHQRGVKVVGHIDTTYHLTGLIDGSEGPREGFFKFYNELWDEAELGPKPVQDPLELLQRKADGSPYSIRSDDFSPWPIYHGCLNNPHWRAVLKAWVRRGIARGLDGFAINYFYTNGCVCQYCQRGFRDHLRQRYAADEIRRQFGIHDLDTHQFAEVNGWYKRNEMTPLRLEGQKFADISRKRAFDEVFIEYGRSLKPDLILAQWLHSYQPVATNDERMMLPPDLWARGEDYLWYCVGRNEPTLLMRYMRGAAGDRPFSVCHYERIKIRAAMAELAANGGSPMTRYADFTTPESRKEVVRFLNFMKRHDAIYHANRMAGEAVLLYPRSEIQNGRLMDALTAFHAIGDRLLAEHVLFDVLPDDLATPERLAGYRRVFTPSSAYDPGDLHSGLSRFEAPPSVRVSANRPAQGEEIDIHFVNYARRESDAAEHPMPVSGMSADIVLPPGFRASRVEFITPEVDGEPVALPMQQAAGTVRFAVPEVQVYGVARVYLERGTVAGALPSRLASFWPQSLAMPAAAASHPQRECDGAGCLRDVSHVH